MTIAKQLLAVRPKPDAHTRACRRWEAAVDGVAVASEAPDICIENYGSIVLLRPATTTGRRWLEANCDRSGYQPFGGGTLLCEPRYVGNIVAGAREAGLRVS